MTDIRCKMSMQLQNKRRKRENQMACRKAYRTQETKSKTTETVQTATKVSVPAEKKAETTEPARILFGVDSRIPANDLLQNNIDLFEWAKRNKLYPNFWGRNIDGEEKLTKDEIKYLHKHGCKVAAIYSTDEAKETEAQGKIMAKKIDIIALELGIPEGAAIFLEIGEKEKITKNFLKGFSEGLLVEGYTPAFKANTDAKYTFDKEYSRGMQTNRELFSQCLIWSVSPSLEEYDHITTSHLIHPDKWAPYAPSGITRNDIAVWQYGKECHPINDDMGKETTFNVNLVRKESVIIEKMF